jgi:hypothetical protein
VEIKTKFNIGDQVVYLWGNLISSPDHSILISIKSGKIERIVIDINKSNYSMSIKMFMDDGSDVAQDQCFLSKRELLTNVQEIFWEKNEFIVERE